jgi:hypothetical protein
VLVAAIRAAQADEIRYPEFLKRAVAAGTAAYWAFLTGKRVIYFGRNGEFHVEEWSSLALGPSYASSARFAGMRDARDGLQVWPNLNIVPVL